MLHEIDAVLRSLLQPAELRFDAPGPSWVDTGSLGFFLHTVREDLESRQAAWLDDRNERGRVVARRSPPRRYRFGYLVTAWAADVAAEHALLGTALAALTETDVVPVHHLTPAMRDSGLPVTIAVAHPELPAAAVELWSALGLAPRTALDVVVTAALVSPPDTDLAIAPRAVELGVASTPPARAATESTRTGPTKRIREYTGEPPWANPPPDSATR